MGHKVYQKYAIAGKFKMGYGAKIIYKTGLIFSPYVAHFSPKRAWCNCVHMHSV